MPTEPDNREREIFGAAVELPANDRAAYVHHACAGDTRLAQRVQRLLAAHDRAETSVQGNAGPPRELPEPRSIGPYRLVERVGEGGMGEVYLAEQTEPVRRRVALKVIKLGMDTREVIARFESERQALALMNHQGIARILDAGTTDESCCPSVAPGRSYFVMEYVRGISITDYCDKMRLPVEARLELFRDVCLAIQHAHQKGIIHRDIKPSNVLVSDEDGQPTPKVIDFGVAKATDFRLSDVTLHTQIGHFIGTPRYMSPEQAEMSALNVDTRSDVYSLGAVLHELLIGVPALDLPREFGLTEIQRIIRSVEPALLRNRLATLEAAAADAIAHCRSTTREALRRTLGGELEWITARALAKNPNRRYQTAQALAEDVDNHLRHQPVEAGPEGLMYRSRKFVRRHRASIAVALVVSLALVGGLATATFGLLEARRERDSAQQALADAETVTAFLAHMVSAADPEELGKDVTVLEVLDKAAAAIGDEFADTPLIEARLRGSIGETYLALGRLPDAEFNLQRRLDLHRDLLPADDPRLMDSVHELGRVYHRQGRFREAEQAYAEALASRRAALGGEHRDTLSSMNNLALVFYLDGRYAEAHQMWERLLEIDRRVSGDEHPNTFTAMNNFGLTLRYYGRYDEALDLYRRTVEGRRRVLGADHPATLMAIHNLSSIHTVRREYAESERLLLPLLAKYQRIVGAEHPRTLLVRAAIGQVYYQQGRHAEAAAMLESTLESRRRVLGPVHPETLNSAVYLARVYLVQARLGEAAELLRHAIANAPEGSQDWPMLAMYRADYGRCLLLLERLTEAEAVLLESYAVLASVVESGGMLFLPHLRQAAADLTSLYEKTERPGAAQRYRTLPYRERAATIETAATD